MHGYLVPAEDGYLLVDTGLGLPGLPDEWAALLPQLDRPVTSVLVTHFHPDHVGGTADAAEVTGAPVLQGAIDHYQCEKVWGSDVWVPQLAAWFERQGVPAEEAAELLEVGSVYRQFVHFVPEARLLREGDEVDGWAVLEFPGHADGHICLLKDGILIAGDHLLPRITPAVGLYPDSRPGPPRRLPRLARAGSRARAADSPCRATGSRSTTPPDAPARSSSTTASGSTRPRRRSATARKPGTRSRASSSPAS